MAQKGICENLRDWSDEDPTPTLGNSTKYGEASSGSKSRVQMCLLEVRNQVPINDRCLEHIDLVLSSGPSSLVE